MKKYFAGIGVIALVALGATGAAHSPKTDSVQPVAQVATVADAIIASPHAVLVQPKPVVRTTAAKRVVVPVAPVVVPVAPVAAQSVAVPVAVPVARCEEDQPCWNCHTMGNRVCGSVAVPKPVQPVTVAVAPEPPGKPVYGADGKLIGAEYQYSAEQLEAMRLVASTR